MRFTSISVAIVLVLAASADNARAQTTPPQSAPIATAPGQARQLTIDDAVRLALDNNLGIQIARIDPQVQDLAVALARAAWVPTLTTQVQGGSATTPNASFLNATTGGNNTVNGHLLSNVGVAQQTPWGGSYSVGWDSSRQTTNSLFTNFSPQLNSTLSLDIRQPLLRNFHIDSLRQQVIVSQKDRDISDIQTQQTVATTERAVKNAYWDLAYANASLTVQQQSLDLANESLRETNARIQIGSEPPIDAVQAEAEVAAREEAVIVAQAQIEDAQDNLRSLVFNQSAPDFWTTRIIPSDLPAFQPTTVDLDSVVRNALQMRTDLLAQRKSLEASDVTIDYYRNQTMPDVSAQFDYGLTGLGGTQFLRGTGFPGPIIGQSQRGFPAVLSDLFTNQFPSWTLGLNISYPVGRSPMEANLARARLQTSQAETQLKNAELQVVTQVRQVARQVTTNSKLVESTRAARVLQEQKLDAEQKKLAAGTSTNFLVFQAQRDLAQARNDELNAILNYNRALVDLETVQVAPVAGSSTATLATATAASVTPGTVTQASTATNVVVGATTTLGGTAVNTVNGATTATGVTTP